MPSFSCSSSVRVASEEHVLRLRITHNLVHGQPSEIVRSVKGRLPKEIDVLWLSDVTVSFSGSLDDHQVPATDISRSGLVRHLCSQLKSNAEQLGLNNLSRPFVDDTDGLAKLTLTPSRPLPTASRPHAKLVSLHLAYIWKAVERRRDVVNSSDLVEDANPFGPTLFLPTEVLLNRVTRQFLIYHLVSRYPLIFGPWCKKLDLEMQDLPSISRSIIEIMRRSQNQAFLSKCKRLIKIARSRHKFVIQASAAAISSCAGNGASESTEEEIHEPFPGPVLTDELVLCESLEQLFRVGVPQRRFKPAAAHKFIAPPAEDDDALLHASQSDNEMASEITWTELSQTVMSPADPYRTLQDDLDVFVDDDWLQQGMCMWRTHEEDTSPGHEYDIDMQWEESLISTPDSSAGTIAAYSPQAAFVAQYRPDVDCPGSDPVSWASYGSSSQEIFLEGSGNSAPILTRPMSHASHDHHDSQNFEQLMRGLGTCQVDYEGFGSVDGDCDEEAALHESDSILLDLDDDINPPSDTPAVGFTLIDAFLESDVTRFDNRSHDGMDELMGTYSRELVGCDGVNGDFLADLWDL